MNIIPSIVAADIMEVEQKLRVLSALPEGLVSWVHIDAVDGKFAKPATWPFTSEDVDEGIKELEDVRSPLKMGVHLMIKHPEDNLDEWMETPVSRICIHDEAVGNIESLLAVVDMTKMDSCVVLKMETDIEELEHLIDRVDVVQLMSIDKIGGYGAKFNPEVFDKIEVVREKYPTKPIIVDGGVSEANIAKLAAAGVDNVVVGSAIWKSNDIEATIRALQAKAKS